MPARRPSTRSVPGHVRNLERKMETLGQAANCSAFCHSETDFPIGQGDINWKRVREELQKIEFQGWATVEVPGGDLQKLADISAQMDRALYS